MLARLQQAITLSLLAAAVVWLWAWWPHSPALAWAGFAAMVLGYSAFLAIEFIALRFISRVDPAPRPGWGALFRAWLGETLVAPRVFCWRQPFRANAIPDGLPSGVVSGQRGVVLIHGFFCNRGFWAPWLQRLRDSGHAFVAVNLEPVFGSIEDYVPVIEAAVRRVSLATGLPPVLVCHSMGGLAARAWLRTMAADDRVHHVITIGTPHRGTWLGRFSTMPNGRQMRLRSDWLRQLGQDEPAHRHALFTCWYSNCDNIVFPASTATLPGADNRLVEGVAHVDLAFRPDVMAASLAIITAV
ncbi:esterase/lipase family protein [Variovorax terrae]|uniref:Alpha/beta fold hydrolase n=1 Tax=Variovorax terrae TaxID=2923278 RepID=A0A9X1VTQ8_9BURK|nr:alpha/beta fold hydrolase [Variovorax terrae]MCJ0761702.1 alpha/beta fold hydrolase [Variovorax terrae]